MTFDDKFELTLAISICTLIIILGAFSCGHPERYGCTVSADRHFICVDGIEGDLITEPCTVSDTEVGAIISCPDGSSVEILDGQDGQVIICHATKLHKICKVK